MQIKKITIFGGKGKDGQKEKVAKVELCMGQIISIVGPTGCGKTTLLNDIELYANKNTPSGRRVLINGKQASRHFSLDPSQHPIALISQHTNFLSDLPVEDFLTAHATIRRSVNVGKIIKETLNFANQLTGEAINKKNSMTELSGGQTRALLIADAVVIGNSPVILLDEIENAGIHRKKALKLLKRYKKIFIFVTHDPTIALFSNYRIVMKNGAMEKVIKSDADEQLAAEGLRRVDDLLLRFRRLIRSGEEIKNGIVHEEIKNLIQ
jgi:ABC-type lipoprotein export system ATPase subunit